MRDWTPSSLRDEVIGRAVLIFLPPGRWGLIDRPAVYSEVDPS